MTYVFFMWEDCAVSALYYLCRNELQLGQGCVKHCCMQNFDAESCSTTVLKNAVSSWSNNMFQLLRVSVSAHLILDASLRLDCRLIWECSLGHCTIVHVSGRVYRHAYTTEGIIKTHVQLRCQENIIDVVKKSTCNSSTDVSVAATHWLCAHMYISH